jgi:hypothetical protein
VKQVLFLACAGTLGYVIRACFFSTIRLGDHLHVKTLQVADTAHELRETPDLNYYFIVQDPTPEQTYLNSYLGAEGAPPVRLRSAQ